MSNVLLVILLFVVVLLVASAVLSRTSQRVQSARDTEYLELEGQWIRYRVDGGGPPVLLVHGWLSSSEVWRPLADRLARRFTVYSLDLTGFGESDKPVSGYGVRYGSRLLYAFCAHFGLTRAAVIGHDVGGAMAVKLAADHPDVVGRLVLVATPASEDQTDLPTPLRIATLPVVGPAFYTLGRFVRPLRKLWMRPFVFDPKDLPEEVVEAAGQSTPAAVTKTLNVTRREISRGRLLRQAGIIKVPVLVVTGEEDRIVDPEASTDWSGTLRADVVLIDRCGHLPMLERPDEFDARLLDFLTSDSRYLDKTGGETREDPPLAEPSPDPDAKPTIRRKSDGKYPAPDPDREPEKAPGDATEDGPSVVPDAILYRRPERRTGRIGDNGAGEIHPDRVDHEDTDRDGVDIPEVPKNLFDLPDSLKEFRPRDRYPEGRRRPGRSEEPGEDAEPEPPTEDEEGSRP